MHGLDKNTGKTISGVLWLEQQIDDILTTPKTTRTMRASYGSNLPKFVDKNINEDFAIEIIAEVNQALSVLKDIFRLENVKINNNNEQITLDISGEYLETGESVKLEGVHIQ